MNKNFCTQKKNLLEEGHDGGLDPEQDRGRGSCGSEHVRNSRNDASIQLRLDRFKG